MTCCIVGVLLTMAFVRVRRLFGRRPADRQVVFAPVAWRPAPGQDWPGAEPAAVASAPVLRRAPNPVLGYCALAITTVLFAVPALAAAGVLRNTGSPAQWLLRGALYATAAGAAVALRRTALWRAPRGVGTLMIVAGAVVFELGVLDMHVFRVIDVAEANMVALFAFHNAGPALAIVGGLVLGYGSLGRSSTSWRPSRSTETSAVPSSSAVTVSATAPLSV